MGGVVANAGRHSKLYAPAGETTTDGDSHGHAAIRKNVRQCSVDRPKGPCVHASPAEFPERRCATARWRRWAAIDRRAGPQVGNREHEPWRASTVSGVGAAV